MKHQHFKTFIFLLILLFAMLSTWQYCHIKEISTQLEQQQFIIDEQEALLSDLYDEVVFCECLA